MTVWLLLFRGVGGTTQLPVRQLKASLTDAGFAHVRTYINSGNAVLTSPLTEDEVAARVKAVCARDLGFTKDVYAVSRADWAKMIAANPFPDAVSAPTTLHAAWLAARPEPTRVEALRARGTGGDDIRVIGRAAYLLTPDGVSASPIGKNFDKAIGVPNTARNWNTVTRLLRLAEEAEQGPAAP